MVDNALEQNIKQLIDVLTLKIELIFEKMNCID